MGKKSKNKVEESQNERALAQVSAAKFNRYKGLYTGVERDYIKKAGQDTGALLRGRSSADIAQASGDAAGKAIALGYGGAGNLGTTAANLSAARTLGAVSANKKSQTIADKSQLGALAIGHDLSADAQSGLAAAARASNTEALGRARAQSIQNEGMMSALGSLAGGAFYKYRQGKPSSADTSMVDTGTLE